MKFKYLITNLHSGSVEGTNNEKLAQELSFSEEHWVVDCEKGKWLTNGKLRTVKEHGE